MTSEETHTLRRLVLARERDLADVRALMAHALPREASPATAPWRSDGRDPALDYACYRVHPDGSRTLVAHADERAPARTRTRADTPAQARRRAMARLLAIIGTSQADFD